MIMDLKKQPGKEHLSARATFTSGVLQDSRSDIFELPSFQEQTNSLDWHELGTKKFQSEVRKVSESEIELVQIVKTDDVVTRVEGLYKRTEI